MKENREAPGNGSAQDQTVSGSPDTPDLDLGFTGKYTHGLDTKGRLIVPVSFREALGSKFAVCPSPDFRKIAVYPIQAWLERRNEYVALCRKDVKVRRILDMFTKYSYVDSEMDGQGRLLLPAALRQKMLGDAREVDVNGAYDHIVVQDARISEQEDASFEADFPDVYAFVSQVQREQ